MLAWMGAGILALLAVHAAVVPEGPWVLLWGCDLAVAAMGVGLVTRRHWLAGVGFLFHVSVGLPVFIVGLLTTHHANPTSWAIHLLPPIAGGIAVARHGLPRGAVVIAGGGYCVACLTGYLLAPPALNVNLMREMWPPAATVFPDMVLYRAAFVAVILAALVIGDLALRRLLARRGTIDGFSSGPVP